MKIYPKEKKVYILYVYGPHYIMKTRYNYLHYIKRLIKDSRNNLLTLQIKYR